MLGVQRDHHYGGCAKAAWCGIQADNMFRVNDVRRKRVHADYTIYVHRASSEHSSRKHAHFARQTGPATTLLERERLLHSKTRGGAWAG